MGNSAAEREAGSQHSLGGWHACAARTVRRTRRGIVGRESMAHIHTPARRLTRPTGASRWRAEEVVDSPRASAWPATARVGEAVAATPAATPDRRAGRALASHSRRSRAYAGSP